MKPTALEQRSVEHSEEEDPLTARVRAISNGFRREILRVLLQRRSEESGLSITQIAEALEVTRFSASRHLHILRTAGLLTATPDPPHIRYRLECDALLVIDEWLSSFFIEWEQ